MRGRAGGQWHGPSPFPKSFHETTLSCTGPSQDNGAARGALRVGCTCNKKEERRKKREMAFILYR